MIWLLYVVGLAAESNGRCGKTLRIEESSMKVLDRPPELHDSERQKDHRQSKERQTKIARGSIFV